MTVGIYLQLIAVTTEEGGELVVGKINEVGYRTPPLRHTLKLCVCFCNPCV